MADIFMQEDITSLLDNRFIVIIGDSIQRAVYKDLVLLLQKNKYLTDGQLRSKGEYTFSGDKLIEGGQYGEMINGVKYREVRQYQTDFHLVRFYFATRCYNSYMESILTDLSKDPRPDVILMNSCLWDISRYGSSSVDDYKVNLEKLFKRFKDGLPKSCLVIWNMTLPISKQPRGGFLIPGIEFMNSTLRLDILEANFFVHKLALQYGYDTLDLHYFLRNQLQRRAGDGVHWDMTAHRRITNLILTHIAQAWSVKTPEHTKNLLFKDKQAINSRQVSNQNTQRKALLNKPFTKSPNLGNLNNMADNMATEMRESGSPLITNNININFSQNMINNMASAIRQGMQQQQGYHQQGMQEQLVQQQIMMSQLQNQIPQDFVDPNQNQDEWLSNQQYQEVQQRENIMRYGGPIRNSNFEMREGFSTMQGAGEIQLGQGQFTGMSWEPYRNQEYDPHLRGQGQSLEGQGHRGRDRRRNPYRTRGCEQHWNPSYDYKQ